MNTHTDHGKEHEKPFSALVFAVIILVTCGVCLGAIYYISPVSFYSELHARWWKWIIVIVASNIFSCFVEWYFHRYVLHKKFPLLKDLYTQHTLHHALTDVRRKSDGTVLDKYPIKEEKQHEASYFPWYAPVAFVALPMPIVVVLQWLLPASPICIGVVVSVLSAISRYELIHANEHKPETLARLQHPNPRVRRRRIKHYRFHHLHHQVIHVNENISGFFGYALADHVMGTYAESDTIHADGDVVTVDEFSFKYPRRMWLTKILDKRRFAKFEEEIIRIREAGGPISIKLAH